MSGGFLKSAAGAALAVALLFAPTAFAKDWKTVVIGMEGAYDPWNLTDSSGKIVGFEPDLAMDLCKRAGFECKIIAQDWDGMIPGLKAGKFDVIMDGMAITDERKKEIDFTKPYAASPGSFLAPKDSPLAKAPDAGKLINLDKDPKDGDAAIKGVQAALKGKTLGVQVSTTHANFAGQYLKDIATVKEYKTTDDRDLDLKSGRLDAVLEDLPTNMATASKPDGSATRRCRAGVHRRRIRPRRGHGDTQERRGPDREVRHGARGGDRRRHGEEALRAVVQGRPDAPIRRCARAPLLKGARFRGREKWAVWRSLASVRAAGAWRSSRAR